MRPRRWSGLISTQFNSVADHCPDVRHCAAGAPLCFVPDGHMIAQLSPKATRPFRQCSGNFPSDGGDNGGHDDARWGKKNIYMRHFNARHTYACTFPMNNHLNLRTQTVSVGSQ